MSQSLRLVVLLLVAQWATHLNVYSASGFLDPSFNGTGRVDTGLDAKDVAIQNDGKIVVAGNNALARYNSNGALDLSFNGNGKVTTTGPVSGVAIQSDGKIVVAGPGPVL